MRTNLETANRAAVAERCIDYIITLGDTVEDVDGYTATDWRAIAVAQGLKRYPSDATQAAIREGVAQWYAHVDALKNFKAPEPDPNAPDPFAGLT